jgi:hypothetical protein
VKLRSAILPAVVLALAAGCGSTPAAAPSARPSATPVQAGYAVTSGKVAIYVESPPKHLVSNGRSFTVHLVLVNGLGHSFPVQNACNGWLNAGLVSRTIGFDFISNLMLCKRALMVKPGITRISRTVITTYPECSQDPVEPKSRTPRCGGPKHNVMPKLPPGAYHLKFDTLEIPNAHIATPVEITLTKS